MMMVVEGQQHLDLERHQRFRRDGAGRQLQGGGGRRECRWHHDHAADQRVGTATGVQNQSNGMQLQLGALSVDFSKVQSVGN